MVVRVDGDGSGKRRVVGEVALSDDLCAVLGYGAAGTGEGESAAASMEVAVLRAQCLELRQKKSTFWSLLRPRHRPCRGMGGALGCVGLA